MFNLGVQELVVITIIALIFIGPKQLPEVARTLGKFFRDLKRASNEITDSFQREVSHLQDEHNNLKKQVDDSFNVNLIPEDTSVSMNTPATEANTSDKKDEHS